MKKTIIFIILTLMMAGFIFYMSSQNSGESTNVSFGMVEYISSMVNFLFGFSPDFHWMKFAEKILRKSAHFILYTVFGIFVMCVLCGLKKPTVKVWIAAAAITAVYAATDEFHQIFVPGRSGELRDILIDTSGGILGSGIIFIVCCLKQHRTKKHKTD